MKKIIWFFLLLIGLYVFLLFTKPSIVEKIFDTLWIWHINKEVLEFKEKLGDLSTNVPTEDEIKEAYSWAKDAVNNLKEDIDDIRKTAKDLEEKYEQTKEFIEDAWEKIEKAKDVIEDLKEVWDGLQEIVWTWSIN